MQDKHFSLDDRPEKKMVRVLMVVFGFLCLATSAWWSVYMIRVTENQNMFWAATLFLFFFGIYQIYAGLGFASRYIIFDDQVLIIRQNSLVIPKKIGVSEIESVEIGYNDITLVIKENKRFRIKLGLKYPDLGENIKKNITEYATQHSIEIFYKNKPL